MLLLATSVAKVYTADEDDGTRNISFSLKTIRLHMPNQILRPSCKAQGEPLIILQMICCFRSSIPMVPFFPYFVRQKYQQKTPPRKTPKNNHAGELETNGTSRLEQNQVVIIVRCTRTTATLHT